MPDFCCTGLWMCDSSDLRKHDMVDFEDLCSEGILLPYDLYQECLEWIKDYDTSHDRENYVFIKEEDWKRTYQTGITIANRIKGVVKDSVSVHFWMEGFKTDEFYKMEIK